MNPVIVLRKTCTCCHRSKPLDQFYKLAHGALGCASECKVCFRARQFDYYLRHKARANAKKTQWQANNREHYNAITKRWRDKNRESYNEYHQQWYHDHKDRS